MNRTWYEKRFEEGKKDGLRQGRLEIVLEMLSGRFGTVSEATREHVESLTSEDLRRIGRELLTAQSFEELGLPS